IYMCLFVCLYGSEARLVGGRYQVAGIIGSMVKSEFEVFEFQGKVERIYHYICGAAISLLEHRADGEWQCGHSHLGAKALEYLPAAAQAFVNLRVRFLYLLQDI